MNATIIRGNLMLKFLIIKEDDTRTIEETKADAKQFTDAAPIFGPYLAYSNIACKYLSPMVKDKLTRKTNKITSIKTAPIIVIGTTRDPATPYDWAVGLNKIFTSSKLISLDADGHTGQGRGSAKQVFHKGHGCSPGYHSCCPLSWPQRPCARGLASV